MPQIATKTDIPLLIMNGNKAIEEAKNFLNIEGEMYMLGEWVTIKRYCTMFGIENIETVLNWINRGIVPKENVRTIAELNGIKLIRAIRYKNS